MVEDTSAPLSGSDILWVGWRQPLPKDRSPLLVARTPIPVDELCQSPIHNYGHRFAKLAADLMQIADATAMDPGLVEPFIAIPGHPFRCHMEALYQAGPGESLLRYLLGDPLSDCSGH